MLKLFCDKCGKEIKCNKKEIQPAVVETIDGKNRLARMEISFKDEIRFYDICPDCYKEIVRLMENNGECKWKKFWGHKWTSHKKN